MTSAAVRRVEHEQTYELVVDGQTVSVVGYEQRGTTVVLLHTATVPEFRNRGLATQLVGEVLEDLRARQLTPSVVCPFIRAYLREQPRADR